MLTEYERKRLEYNLAVNDLNKFKKDFDAKRIEINKRKFNSECKIKEENIENLRKIQEEFFEQNKVEIANKIIVEYLGVSLDYSFYNDEIKKDDDGSHYISKKTKEDINNYIESLKVKSQKYLDDKVITQIIYNDLIKCLAIYEEQLLNEWKKLEVKKNVTVVEEQEIKKEIKKKKNKPVIDNSENVFYKRLILPLLIIDIVFLVYLLINGFECKVVDSEIMSSTLCALNVMGRLYSIFITPFILLYFIVKGFRKIAKK